MAKAASTDSDIRKSLAKRSKKLSLVQLWDVLSDVEITEPRRTATPHLWKWDDVYPQLLGAKDAVPIEEAERRVLVCANPSLYPKPYTASTLYVSFSIYNPKETVPAHRHTPNASRFVLQGDGGFTTIEGEKCTMYRGDLIVTPNGTWHDHGNDGTEPIIWLDVLDLPLVEALNATEFEFDYREPPPDGSNTGKTQRRDVQSIREPLDHSTNFYATGGLRPKFATNPRGKGIGTPMYVYRWTDTRKSLERLKTYAGSPYDGIIVEYTDPITGDPVTPTMSFQVQLLRPNERTQTHRHTTSAAYCCIEGSGVTRIEGDEIAWGKNDVFVIPSWYWHEHINASKTKDAVLYTVDDSPVLTRLNLYREQAQTTGGEITPVAP